MVDHIQKKNPNWICWVLAHTFGGVPHKTAVVGEGVHWVAGGGLVGRSEEDKVPLQHDGLMKVGVD